LQPTSFGNSKVLFFLIHQKSIYTTEKEPVLVLHCHIR
jgi:hypothetical protein